MSLKLTNSAHRLPSLCLVIFCAFLFVVSLGLSGHMLAVSSSEVISVTNHHSCVDNAADESHCDSHSDSHNHNTCGQLHCAGVALQLDETPLTLFWGTSNTIHSMPDQYLSVHLPLPYIPPIA